MLGSLGHAPQKEYTPGVFVSVSGEPTTPTGSKEEPLPIGVPPTAVVYQSMSPAGPVTVHVNGPVWVVLLNENFVVTKV